MNNRRWVSPHSLTGVDLLKAKQQQKQKTQDECENKTLRMLKIKMKYAWGQISLQPVPKTLRGKNRVSHRAEYLCVRG